MSPRQLPSPVEFFVPNEHGITYVTEPPVEPLPVEPELAGEPSDGDDAVTETEDESETEAAVIRERKDAEREAFDAAVTEIIAIGDAAVKKSVAESDAPRVVDHDAVNAAVAEIIAIDSKAKAKHPSAGKS